MRIDSFDLFDTTKLVIHEHDEVRKINNTAKTGIILLRGTPPDNTFPLSLFLIIPHPPDRGFKVSVGGMSHSARIGRALFHRARSASTGAPTHGLPFFCLFSIWHVVTRRVARTWVPVRPQRGPYTGRGARTGGLVSDRTRRLTRARFPRSTPSPKTSTHTAS